MTVFLIVTLIPLILPFILFKVLIPAAALVSLDTVHGCLFVDHLTSILELLIDSYFKMKSTEMELTEIASITISSVSETKPFLSSVSETKPLLESVQKIAENFPTIERLKSPKSSDFPPLTKGFAFSGLKMENPFFLK
jgi:hypothetical protein